MTTGSINIQGTLSAVQSFGSGQGFPLSQVISELEVKQIEVNLPPGASNISVALPLSPSVTEVLFLAIYTPQVIQWSLVSSDGGTPGPIKVGYKGLQINTYAPGEGIVSLHASNPDPINAVTAVLIVGSQADPAVIPPFWQ